MGMGMSLAAIQMAPDPVATAAMQSMADFGIVPTPDNFAIWYDYHAGINPDLKRTIDILISNKRGVDGPSLEELHRNFFSNTKEQELLRETSLNVMAAAQEVLELLDAETETNVQYTRDARKLQHSSDGSIGPLTKVLARLIAETNEMAKRSDRLALRMRHSTEKIEGLERTLEKARREATLDSLTGIANRRSFDLDINETAAAAMNTGDDLCLIILDVDYFKKFNDTWGHQTGDEVLKLVAATIQQNVRGNDRVARYGGEEFAIILPATPLDAARTVGENIREAIQRQQFVARESQQTISGITISLGIACYELGEPLLDWISRADNALYQAKHSGRNRICLI
jgi:diguanylate cyclase